MNGPLAALEAIDWSAVTDCYGPVDELPTLLRATLSADADERREALMEARNLTNHQGDVWEASVHIVPFLVQASTRAAEDRQAFVYWLAWSCGREEEAREDRTGLLDRIRDATIAELPELVALIDDTDSAVRRAALMLVAAFPFEITAGFVDLESLVDPDPLIRADVLTVVTHLRPEWAGLQTFLGAALDDADHRVRYQAARILMRISGAPYPAPLVETVADVIAELGLPGADLDAIEQFCDVPGHSWPTAQETGLIHVRIADPLVQDPAAAAHAARRILRSAGPHAGYALTLAQEIDQEWRGRESDTAALALGALPTVAQPRKQYETLRWIAGRLAELRAPGSGLLARLEPWSSHREPALASAAWAAAAHLDRQLTMDRLGSTNELPHVPLEVLCELCRIYGPEADVLIPELRRRIQALPLKEASSEATALLGAVRALGSRSAEFLPFLHEMLERRQGLYALVDTLRALGPEAGATADLIATVARDHEHQHFRLRAALAHRAVSGEHGLARQVAEQIAKNEKLATWSIESLGLLGRDAESGIAVLEEQLAKGSGVRSETALALWRITRDRTRCRPLLAQAAQSPDDAIPALQGLLELGDCPDECHEAITRFAGSQQRILHHARRRPPRHDDYVLQELACDLLAGVPTPTN